MNPLIKFLRAATEAEVLECAEYANTSPAYLTQLARQYGKGRVPSVKLAHAFEMATRKLNKRNSNVPIVTVKDMAQLRTGE